MTEIAQLFESALRHNRGSLLRKAAINTVAQMPATMTLNDLIMSDAGEAIRELTIEDLKYALAEAGLRPPTTDRHGRHGRHGRRVVPSTSDDWSASRAEQIYRSILDAMADEPLTIGQIAKRTDIETEELRGYLAWMKQMGKIQASGRARATRYQAIL